MIHEVILRSSARVEGSEKYFTDKPCKNGHVPSDWYRMGRVWRATAYMNDDGRKRLEAAKRNVRVIADIRQALRVANVITDIGQARRDVRRGAVVRVSRIDAVRTRFGAIG